MREKNAAGATLSVLAAGTLWGILSLFVKPLYAAGISTLQSTFLRLVVAAPVFTIVMLIFDRSAFRVKVRDLWPFACMGILSIVLMNYCYFYTMTVSGASVAVVLMYTSPIFVILLAALLFKERITKRSMIALVMVFAGCVFVSGITESGASISVPSFAAGVMSGLLYGSYSIFGRFAVSKYSSSTVTLYTLLFGLIGSVFAGDPIGSFRMVSSDGSLLLLAFALGIVSTVLPYLFYTFGLKRMPSSRAAIVVTVEPLVGCLIGILIFSEDAGPGRITGMALIILSMFVLNRKFA